jgi:hypothetical protein
MNLEGGREGVNWSHLIVLRYYSMNELVSSDCAEVLFHE